MNPGGQKKHWRDIHNHLVGLAKRRTDIDSEEAEWLLDGVEAEVHKRFGHRSFVEYLGVVFGYTPREASERLRVARSVC